MLPHPQRNSHRPLVTDSQNQMNGVEAAASLFGSEEPSSDPFAALGTDTAPQSSSGDLFYGDGAFGTPDFLDPQTTHNAEVNSALEPVQPYTQQESTIADVDYTSSSYTPDLGAATASQQGWYDEQGQSNYFEEHVSAPTTTCKVLFFFFEN
jgi:hypothetical protein